MARAGEDARWLRSAVLLGCVAAHVGLGVWLVRTTPTSRSTPTDAPLEVFFIPAELHPAASPPSFRQAPSRPRVANIRSSATARATPSAPPDPAPARHVVTDVPPPSTARLLQAAEMLAHAPVRDTMPLSRDPTRRHAPKLPGRGESYTPEAITLRDPWTPQRVVAVVGGLFGGNYNPCPDTRSKISDLVARDDPREREELMLLIDRERRRCR